MVRTWKRIIKAYIMTAIMCISLMGGVVGNNTEAKAFNSEGRIIDATWDIYLSKSDGTIPYVDTERIFADEEHPNYNTYRGEINKTTSSDAFTYYIHLYSSNGGEFEDVTPWVRAYDNDPWEPTDPDIISTIQDASSDGVDDAINSTISIGEKVSATDSTTTDEGARHYVYAVTVNPGSEAERFSIGFTNHCEDNDYPDVLANVVIKKRDALWVSNNINDLSSEVGAALYKAPKDGNKYLGKVYYYSSSVMYPNVNYSQIQDQNAGDWSSSTDEWWTYRGIYDSDGNPLGSHIFYQYYHLDKDGNALTEDGGHPVSYLVYDEYPENTSTGATCQSAFTTKFGIGGGFVNSCTWTNMPTDGTAIIAPGEYHANVARTFNTDLYSVWGPYGSVTINGDVMSMTLGRGYRTEEFANDERKYVGYTTEDVPNALHEEHTDTEAGGSRYWVNDAGERIYWWSLEELYPNDRDAAMNNKVFQDEDFASDTNISLPLATSSYTDAAVRVNGNIGYVSLTDTYQGALIVGNNKSVEGMSLDKLANTAYKENEADITFYGTYIGQGQTIIENGSFINSIQPFDEGMWQQHLVFGAREDLDPSEIDNLNGYSVIMGGEKNNETVSGTSSAVDTYGTGAGVDALDINVSESVGGGVFPMVRRKTHTDANAGTWKDPDAWWTAIKSYLNVTSATIMDIALVQDNENLVEPARPVNLYIDGPGARITGKALYHVREDGVVEKLSSSGIDGSFAAETGSFSTYFVADDKDVPSEKDNKLTALAEAQHDADAPVQLDEYVPYTPSYTPSTPTVDNTPSGDASKDANVASKDASENAEASKDAASADASKDAEVASSEASSDAAKSSADAITVPTSADASSDASNTDAKEKTKSKQTITVKPVTKVYKAKKLLKKKYSFKIKVNGNKTALTYKSSKPSVVSVTQKGKVTIKKKAKKGTYKITIQAKESAKYKASNKVKVMIKVK